jgi:hypothetical protein
MMRLAAGEFAKKCWPGLTMLMMSMILLLLVLEREIFLGQVLPVRKAASFLHTGSSFLHTTTHRSLIDIISIVRPGQHFLANSPAANLIISDLIWCVRINTSYIVARSLRTHFSLTKLSSYMDFSHL